ncbi:MAG: HAD family hydrolase [Chloroflexi bacterium]|nr:MAG: HAD family hydrolase [Chloroflexota bacterium]
MTVTEQFDGLTTAEVIQRQKSGAGNDIQTKTSRTNWSIIRTNLFSTYNLILFVISAILAILGRYNDAFITVIVGILNALIGTFQEIRAKRQLDQIAVVANPQIFVQRDGTKKEVTPADLVRGDLIWLYSGEQAVVDGKIVDQGFVEMDESLLTGESDHIRKQHGDQVLSGSFCVTGSALYQAEQVGNESYANRLTAEAKKFEITFTPLQTSVSYVINLIILLAAIMAAIFYLTGFIQDFSFLTNIKATAVLVGLVPYGLFLTISAAYAMGASAIAKKGALVQHINAVESINSIDVLCMDKTGTLTSNELVLDSVYLLQDDAHAQTKQYLGDFVRSVNDGNKTNEAIAHGTSGLRRQPIDEIPFSSVRKCSALAFADKDCRGVFVLGAFEMMADHLPQEAVPALEAEIATLSDKGLRVLLFAANYETTSLHDVQERPLFPALTPLALITLQDSLRPHVAKTIEAFLQLGVQLKIISGDSPQTVTAVARQAGLVHTNMISGPELANMSVGEFAQAADDRQIFGRITPEQKQQVINSLIKQGHRVAMIGDGVNDVLSLKKAHLGIAMQSGSNAARNVADMVLLNDSYEALPHVLSESKRVINGIIDATYLLIGRSLIYAFIIIGVMMVGISFPFEPAQTGLTTFSVGIPAFALMLWANAKEKAEPLLRSLVRLVIPYTLWTMLLGVLLYSFTVSTFSTNLSENDLPPRAVERLEAFTGVAYDLTTDFEIIASTVVAQTTLSAFLTLVAILFVLFLNPPHSFFTGWREVTSNRQPMWMVIILTVAFLVMLNTKPVANYFGMLKLPPPGYVSLMMASLIWLLGMRFILRQNIFDHLLLPSDSA